MLTACPKKYISQFTDERKATERYSHVKNQPCCFVCFSVGLAIYFYSWKKQRAISLLCLRTLRQNNLAETSSSSQRLQQTLNKSIIPIRIKWQTHLSPGISTISRPNPLPWDGNPGWLDGWMALLDPHFLPSQLQDFASKLRLPPTANIPPNCTKDTALQNYFITDCSSFL